MTRRTWSYEGAGEDEDVTGTIFPLLWPGRSDLVHFPGVKAI